MYTYRPKYPVLMILAHDTHGLLEVKDKEKLQMLKRFNILYF